MDKTPPKPYHRPSHDFYSPDQQGEQFMNTERAKVSFPVREMAEAVNGGKKMFEAKEKFFQLIEKDPDLRISHYYDRTRTEAREKTMLQIRRYLEIKKTLKDPEMKRILFAALGTYDPSFQMRVYVHEMIFRETLWSQGTDEQFKQVQDDVDNWRILGCFAMTELGHSSHLQGLETTATYDPQTDEFVIETPTITGAKWWIGMAGQAATHTVLLAQLKIGDKHHGLQWFFVPLRNRSDGRLVPGVTAGDVGQKISRPGLDNGWIIFTGLRVPRTSMLMRYWQVDDKGRFGPSPNLKGLLASPSQAQAMTYATLVGERLMVMPGILDILGQASTVATRYSIVRVQGATDEQRLINFPIHQARILPALGLVYLVSFAGKHYLKRWDSVLLNLRKLSEGGADHMASQVLSDVAEMHSISAGTKAWLGWMAGDMIEILRRCLGGHGYSAYNSLGALNGDYAVMMTGGGDNIVLAQQNARFLLNCLKKAFLGKPLPACVAYFQDIPNLVGSQPTPVDTFPPTTLSEQISLMQTLVKFMLMRTSERLQARMQNEKDSLKVWNEFVGELLPISRIWTFAESLTVFLKEMETVPESIRGALLELMSYWALTVISDNFELFLTFGVVKASVDLKEKLETAKATFCEKIRQNAIGFVDALCIPDWLLKAPIGAYDGKIYSKYFQTVLEAPNAVGVPKYWKKHIKPLTHQSSKL